MQAMKDFQFEATVRHDVVATSRCYYTRDLKYRGNDFFIPSEWFKSTGPQETYDKKPELLVPVQAEYLNILTEI